MLFYLEYVTMSTFSVRKNSCTTIVISLFRLKVHLVFFNKTENDIMLQEELERLMSDNSR